MLELLRIKNLALIEDMEMELAPGLNVLTGETGAGKSFVLKALNFVSGERLGPELVRPGKEKATVEALFVMNGEDMVIRRELTADSGRSRLYINDQLSSLETARELRPSLLVHTSQHGQQKLLQPSFQAALLDAFLEDASLIPQKDSLQKKLADIITRRNTLQEKITILQDKRDMLEFQYQEIEKVGPKPGEEEALEAERATFRSQASVGESAANALELLHDSKDGPGLHSLFSSFTKQIHHLAAHDGTLATTPDMLAEMESNLRDMEKNLRRLHSRSLQEVDIEAIEARLYALAQLKRKLKRPLPAILAMRDEIEAHISFLDSCGLELKELAKEEKDTCDALAALLALLNKARQETAHNLTPVLEAELARLGFSRHVRVQFDFTAHSLHPERTDCMEMRARLLWMPNPGQPPQPLDKIASGGELSRFLLAVVSVMSRKTEEEPTLIFDEVDAGVGGLTLNSVANRLEELAVSRQLLLITHWPQLAARAARHFYIQKEVQNDQTFTSCSRLQGEAITGELARMAGGGEQSAVFAKELLHQ